MQAHDVRRDTAPGSRWSLGVVFGFIVAIGAVGCGTGSPTTASGRADGGDSGAGETAGGRGGSSGIAGSAGANTTGNTGGTSAGTGGHAAAGTGGHASGGTAGANPGGAAGSAGAIGTGGGGAVGGTGGASGAGGGETELIHYYGRWNRIADRAITVNTGSHVVATFSGTGVSARFNTTVNQAPNPTLAWRIDGGQWNEGELAATLPLATGLSAGPHEVTLMVRGFNEYQRRWIPPLVSSITFLGLDVTGGTLELSLRPVRPKFEFLGDSITEGLYIWSMDNTHPTIPWQADAPQSWASQTAQNLGVEWRQVGFGGQGLLKGGSSNVPPANDAFNWVYQGVLRDSWQPDVVVINQGTNDGGASASTFRPAYTTFIGTVRAAYSDAKVVAMRPYNGAHAAEIQAEVNARKAAGDTRIFYIDTTGWLGDGDFTDGTHPNTHGSTKAATALTAAIHSLGIL